MTSSESESESSSESEVEQKKGPSKCAALLFASCRRQLAEHPRLAPEVTLTTRRHAGTSSVLILSRTPMTASASFAARRWDSFPRAALASRSRNYVSVHQLQSS